MAIDSNANRGIHALLVVAMVPLVATRSNRSTVITRIAAKKSGSFHMAIEYVANKALYRIRQQELLPMLCVFLIAA